MSPSTALVAYAESLFDGRRVVVVGDASTALAEDLVERGARVVHVLDADAGRAGEAAARNRSRNISFAPLADADVVVREGGFDVAFVPDLAAFPDRARLIQRVRRALSSRGVALFAARNPEARGSAAGRASPSEPIGYYDLYDLVAGAFDEVRMLGQTPFVGFAVVDFAQAVEPDISFDSGFVPGGAEEPEWYVAAASARSLELDPFMVIQLPARVARGDGPPDASADPGGPSDTGADPGGARLEHAAQLATLEAENAVALRTLEAAHADLARARSEIADRTAALEAAHDDLARARSEIADRTAALEAAHADLAHARSEIAERDAQRDALTRALEENTALLQENIALKAAYDALREDASRAQAVSVAPDGAALEALEARIGELEEQAANRAAALAERQARIERLEADLERNDAVADHAALEASLAERAGALRRLERDLAETERIGRDLAAHVTTLTRQIADRASVEPLGAAAPDSGPVGSPVSTARRAAEREADLEAARWAIDELESLLEARDGPDRAALSRQLAEAHAELQRLETLLTQLDRADEKTAALR
jgi:SAM-dependent methyltransferase